jgi:hypothetical protein
MRTHYLLEDVLRCPKTGVWCQTATSRTCTYSQTLVVLILGNISAKSGLSHLFCRDQENNKLRVSRYYCGCLLPLTAPCLQQNRDHHTHLPGVSILNSVTRTGVA